MSNLRTDLPVYVTCENIAKYCKGMPLYLGTEYGQDWIISGGFIPSDKGDKRKYTECVGLTKVDNPIWDNTQNRWLPDYLFHQDSEINEAHFQAVLDVLKAQFTPPVIAQPRLDLIDD